MNEEEQAVRARAKQLMREQMRRVRRALPHDACAARSAAVCERLIALPAFEAAQAVIGYVAFAKEADPSAALAAARERGKRVGLVRIEDEQHLSARLHQERDELCQSSRGMLEPLAGAPRIAESEIDLIIVPALGIDERGYRLGYGGGFYDRFLPALPHAQRVAIAYDFQLLMEIPNVDSDARMDWLVTDQRVVQIDADAQPKL